MLTYNPYSDINFSFDQTILKNKAVVKTKHPVNLRAARRIGFKSKPGFHTFTIKVKKGNRVTKPANARRRTKSFAPRKTLSMSNQRIAESRVCRKYRPLQLLNSYKISEKTRYNYYEVVLYDPNKINKTQKYLPGRSFRGICASCRN